MNRRHYWWFCVVYLTSSAVQLTTCVTTPLPKADIDLLCKGCIMWQGVGYKAVKECHKYMVCVFKADGSLNYHLSRVRVCEENLFWSQIKMACLPADEVDCPQDPCQQFQGLFRRSAAASSKSDHVVAWTSPSNCRAYWGCRGGKTQGARCCPPKESPVINQGNFTGCVANPKCLDRCGEPIYYTKFSENCKQFSPHPSNRRLYKWTHGGRQYIMRCSKGTLFHPVACACLIDENFIPPQDCQRDMYIPLEDDLLDKHGHHVQATNVEVTSLVNAQDENAGLFEGASNLRINRYSNAHFGNSFAIQMRLEEERNGNKIPMTLFSNGCNHTTAPIHVTINGVGEIRAKIIIDKEVKKLSLDSETLNGPKILTLAYDGKKIYMQARSDQDPGTTQRDEQPASGDVPNNPCALVIGSETNMDATPDRNFKGMMEEIMVYLCVPNYIKNDMESD